MLGLTSRKKAPALETLETAEVRVGRLPSEPLAVLQELAALMDLLFSGSRIAAGQAYPIADLLDRTGRPHLRRIAQEYVLGHKQLTRFQNDRIWNAVTIYLTQLAKVYRYCLAQYEVGARGARSFGRMLPTIAARTMRACAARMKWYDLRYIPLEVAQWQELAAVYLLSESGGFARESLSLYRKAAQDSSVEQEFLRVAMLAIASPGSMLPEQIEVAERLVAHCAPHFLIGARPSESMRYFIDLHADAGPHRMPLSGRIPATARAFGAGNAIGELQRILERLDAGQLTRGELGLSQEFDFELIRAAARHLLRYWDPPLPDRRSARQQESARIDVVYDFDEVTAKVGAIALQSPFVAEQETWLIENHSPHGLRARVPSPQGLWITVGSLVAFRQADDSLWSVGVVRRLKRKRDEAREVAVETLARGGSAVTVLPRIAGKDKDKAADQGVLSVLLPGSAGASEEVRLLSPPGTFSDTMPLEMRAYDRAYVLFPIELVETGADFQIARFKILRHA
jgi:hypothetical protein